MASIDADGPLAGIRRVLAGRAGSPQPTGRLERCPALLHRQIAMQLRKRRPPRP